MLSCQRTYSSKFYSFSLEGDVEDVCVFCVSVLLRFVMFRLGSGVPEPELGCLINRSALGGSAL